MNDDDLGKMCDTAQSCDALARTVVGYVVSHTFSTDEWCANQQARVLLLDAKSQFDHLAEKMWKWKGIPDTFGILDCIKVAVASRVEPIFVAGTAYMTAHEAAVGHAEAALLAWNSFEGENDRKKCEDLQRRLQGIKCPDLYHQIEWECLNADIIEADRQLPPEGRSTDTESADAVPTQEAGGPPKKTGGRTPSKKIAKRNKKIVAAFKKGATINEVVTEYGVSANNASQILSRANATERES